MRTERRRRGSGGFSLVEAVLALTILSLLVAVALNVSAETATALWRNDAIVTRELSTVRVLAGLADVLRRSGQVDDDVRGVSYPRVTEGGAALEFRLPTSAPTPPLRPQTSSVVWDPRVFTARVDARGELTIADEKGRTVRRLGRTVGTPRFEVLGPGTVHAELVSPDDANADGDGGTGGDFAILVTMRN